MTRAKHSRGGFSANALLLCVNLALLLIWVFAWLAQVCDPFLAEARRGAAKQGLELYYAKYPFAIYVDKEFPRKQEFWFWVCKPRPLMTMWVREESDGELNARFVTVGLPDSDVSFAYRLDDPSKFEELRYCKKNEGLIDLNADGSFDLRWTAGPKPKIELWYNGRWQEEDLQYEGSSKYQRRLVGGELVRFDRQRGLWLPATERAKLESATSGEDRAP